MTTFEETTKAGDLNILCTTCKKFYDASIPNLDRYPDSYCVNCAQYGNMGTKLMKEGDSCMYYEFAEFKTGFRCNHMFITKF